MLARVYFLGSKYLVLIDRRKTGYTHRVDFEERVRFLLDILRDRGYNIKLLGRQFLRAVEKYILVFQRWEIPVNLGDWFRSISDRTS